MGAKLSIINDVDESCKVEVWTLGRGFLVAGGTVEPGKTLTFNKLGAVRYDVNSSLWRSGAQKVETTAVQLQNVPTTIHLSAMFGPSKPQPIDRGQPSGKNGKDVDSEDDTPVGTPNSSSEDLTVGGGRG